MRVDTNQVLAEVCVRQGDRRRQHVAAVRDEVVFFLTALGISLLLAIGTVQLAGYIAKQELANGYYTVMP